MQFGDALYQSSDRAARITLNRPGRFNVISETMSDGIADAFQYANNDDSVHAVVLTGAGRGFCGGYDLNVYARASGENPAIQEMPRDPMMDYPFMRRCTEKFVSV